MPVSCDLNDPLALEDSLYAQPMQAKSGVSQVHVSAGQDDAEEN